MQKQTALITILIISIAGVIFSGYLSYGEIFNKTCSIDGCTTVGSVPACVYGFIMYIIVFAISILGLKNKAEKKR